MSWIRIIASARKYFADIYEDMLEISFVRRAPQCRVAAKKYHEAYPEKCVTRTETWYREKDRFIIAVYGEIPGTIFHGLGCRLFRVSLDLSECEELPDDSPYYPTGIK